MGSRIVVDSPKNGWCHMMCDGDDADLLAFAVSIGMKPEWIQYPGTDKAHFDLRAGKRRAAVVAGAEEVKGAALVAIMRAKRDKGVKRG